MSLDHIASTINIQLCRENERICQLQEKLVTYNEDVNEKADLQIRVADLQQLMENLENNMKQNNADQTSMTDTQKKKLKKIEEEEAVIRATNTRFVGLNDRMFIQIVSLKEREKILLCEINKLEEHKQVLENELCKAKETMDELSNVVGRLKKCLKVKEEELCCVKGLVEQQHDKHEQLKEACCKQESELQRTVCKLGVARSRADRAKDQLACEKHDLCCVLETKRTALRDVTEQLTEVKQTVDRERARVRQLKESAVEQQCANEQDKRDADAQAHRLNRENRDKEVSVCRMKEQIKELRGDGERTVADMRMVKEQVRADECLLETAKLAVAVDASTARPGDGGCGGGGSRDQLERDTDALACDALRKTKKIAELERQVCSLRNELGAAECAISSCCPPPSCCTPPKPPCCTPPEPPCCTPPKPPCCAPPKPPCCAPPKPPCSAPSKPPQSSISCSSVDLSSVKSTCSSDDDGFFTELKQLYSDVEKLRKGNSNNSCTDTT